MTPKTPPEKSSKPRMKHWTPTQNHNKQHTNIHALKPPFYHFFHRHTHILPDQKWPLMKHADERPIYPHHQSESVVGGPKMWSIHSSLGSWARKYIKGCILFPVGNKTLKSPKFSNPFGQNDLYREHPVVTFPQVPTVVRYGPISTFAKNATTPWW